MCVRGVCAGQKFRGLEKDEFIRVRPYVRMRKDGRRRGDEYVSADFA